MITKEFHLGDVLSVTTGRLVSPRGMEGVQDILSWMTGENLFTHQLVRAVGACKVPILARHPDLARITVPEFKGDSESRGHSARIWLAVQAGLYGEMLEVEMLPPGSFANPDPIREMAEAMPDAKATVVVVPE